MYVYFLSTTMIIDQAKASFLEQIPNLAYAFTAIDMWLKTFFAMPALDSSVSKGGPPSPQHEHGKMCWGEEHRCDGEITNTSNHYFLSCYAERATSSHNCQPAQQLRS